VRIIRFLLFITACTVVFALSPCFAAEEPSAEGESPDTTSETGDPILARVNDHPIRQSDVDQLYADFKISPEDVPVERAIEELIRRESIRQFILASGVEIDDEAVDAEYKDFMQRLIMQGFTPEQFLEQRRVSEEQFREIVRIQLALEKLAEEKLTRKEVDAVEEQVRASHILAGVPRENPTEADFEEAKEQILRIQQEIDDGRPFEECAKLYSACPSKDRGGDLGFFPRTGAMVEPFAEVAYALEVGEISEPVKTQFGYHLIMVTDRSKKPGIEKLIEQKVPAVIEEIRAKVKVERLYRQSDTTPDDDTPSTEEE
jgi:parvulin-like peptidyl-prolyl isomerase